MRRYPGITPFKVQDAPVFKGRATETQEVTNLILTQKTLVLFAKSGMGKTSLLNAGVVPALKRYGFYSIPIRFNQFASGGGDAEQTGPMARFISQYQQAYDAFNRTRSRAEAFAPQATLREVVSNNPFILRRQPLIPLLVFDQFEEFFRTYPQRDQRVAFLQQLAELLSDTMQHANGFSGEQVLDHVESKPVNVRVVFSIRSDMLNLMQEVSDFLPFVLQTRYELLPMLRKQAEQAIREPGLVADGPYETGPITFPDACVNDILTGVQDAYSGEIESFQLQLVCSYLEDKYIAEAGGPIPSKAITVKQTDYGGLTGLQNINEAYFSNTINAINEQPRTVIMSQLVTLLNDNGNRILKEDSELDLMSSVKDRLVDHRILKRDKIQGNTYYEISHDKIALGVKKEKEKFEADQKLAQERSERNRKIRNAIIGLGILTLVLSSFFTIEINSTNKELERKSDSLTLAQDSLQKTVGFLQDTRDSLKAKSDTLEKYNNKLKQARLKKAWSDFENAKTLMKARLFMEAKRTLDSVDAGTNNANLSSYHRLRKLTDQARKICEQMIPVQKLMEKGACLEGMYYLRCANEAYVMANGKQKKLKGRFKAYYFSEKQLATRLLLTDQTTRSYAYSGLNRADSPIKDINVIEQSKPCNCK